MMISTTHDEAQNNRLRWKSYTIRILAAAFWILVWQLASMWLKQEILLASPVSVVKKLWQLLPQADFWKTVEFSFVRIVSGFLLGLFAGTILAAAACGCKVLEILLAPVVDGYEVGPCCFIYYLVPDLASIQESFCIYHVSYGVSGSLYKCMPGHPGNRPGAFGNGPGVSGQLWKKGAVYLHFTGCPLFSGCLPSGIGALLESRKSLQR